MHPIKFFSAIIVVMTGFLIPSQAAALSVISSNTFEIELPPGTETQVAIDVSTNLITWLELTNLPRLGDRITFSDPDALSASPRFYRVADADKTVLLKGYVDGGSKFGAVGAAEVGAVGANGYVKTDANGYFQFNTRYSLDHLPLLGFGATGFWPGNRQIYPNEAGGIIILPLEQRALDQFWTPQLGIKYHFQVKTGLRAGMNFTGRFGGGAFFDEDASGDAWFNSLGFANFQISWFNMQSSYLQFIGTDGALAFSGIPSPTGAISGNGTVIEEPPTTIAPAYPTSITFHIEKGLVAPKTYTLRLSGTFRAGYLLIDGDTVHTNTFGRLYDNFYKYGSNARFAFDNYDYDDLALLFTDSTKGVFYGSQQVSTNHGLVEGTFEYTTNTPAIVPATLANRTIKFADHTFTFGESAYTEQSSGAATVSGSYTVERQQNSLWVKRDEIQWLFLYFFDERSGVAEYEGVSADNIVAPFTMD